MGTLCAAFQTLVAAQAALASITGTVRDAETGAPLPGAIVAMDDLSRIAIADSAGHYELARLPGGSFSITVRFQGYSARSLLALVPSSGHLEIDLALQVQSHRLPPIEVTMAADARAAPSTGAWFSPDRMLRLSDIRSDPMLAEPDAFAALHGGSVTLDPESLNGVHVRGGASDQTAYLLDGIPVLSAYHAAGLSSAWNPDLLSGVSLATPAGSTLAADAVSATVEGLTRSPGARLGTQGSLGTGQARIAVDGPLGRTGIGFLLGFRSRTPNLVAPDDPTYLNGSARDWLAKLELPALGGVLQFLAYDNHNAYDVASSLGPGDQQALTAVRNQFAWSGHSIGAEWTRVGQRTRISVRAWNATAVADVAWRGGSEATSMNAAREDYGFAANVERRSTRGWTSAGVRLVHGSAEYRVAGSSLPTETQDLNGSAPIATLSIRQVQALGPAVSLDLGVTGSVMRWILYPAPRAALTWAASGTLSFSGSASRTWQFTQSLRNAESVVDNIFPAELYVSAAAPGVPVLRSDLGVLAARYRVSAASVVTLEFFARADQGLLLVAPVTGGPFANGAFVVGSGTARGGAAGIAWSRGPVSATANYTLQDVQYAYPGGSYAPSYGVAHQLELGVAWNPSPSWSFRASALGAAGRRSTEITGGFEWEACNLLDRGCEFGGSPTNSAVSGATGIPVYARADLGARKQWSVNLGGRPGILAVFGTVTNIFGRSNVLTYTADTATGERTAIEMRPRSPLVLGVDWSF